MLWMFTTGCPKSTEIKTKTEAPTLIANIPKSDRPLVRILAKQGKLIKYIVYNTSNQAFQGVIVVFSGIDCDGTNPRQIWTIESAPMLDIGRQRTMTNHLPIFCRRIEVEAFDKPLFVHRIKKHQPFVRYVYSRANQQLQYHIRNQSILPFRGLAIVVRATNCVGPKPRQLWIEQSPTWLYPGYNRSFKKVVPVACGDIVVQAFDLINFRQLIQKYIQERRNKQIEQQPIPHQHYNEEI
jgi:hypothetical protein